MVMPKVSAEEKRKRCIDVHGSTYDYSQADFDVYMYDKIDIICRSHGKFSQHLSSHLRGCGCRICAGIVVSAEQKRQRAIDAHADKYDYSQANFDVNTGDKIDIICKVHGLFSQRLGNHISGRDGCSECSNGGGYDGAKRGVFYALHVIEADVVKIGITNKSVAHTYTDEKSEYEVIFELPFEDGKRARDLETNAKQLFKPHRYEGSPALTTRRNTEVFCISKEEVIEYARQCGVL